MNESADFRGTSAAFLAHRHDLQAFVLSMTRDPVLTEDILQDVWVKLAEAASQGTRIDHMHGWCRAVAKHAILRHWQRAGRERAADAEIIELIDGAFDRKRRDDDSWAHHLEALRGCLGALQAAARRLVEARYVRGLGAEEIATAEGSSYDAVMMRLTRLRQALKQCVVNRMADGDPA
jgi:RNA polymerase sigma-70 factor, ECF subfamily